MATNFYSRLQWFRTVIAKFRTSARNQPLYSKISHRLLETGYDMGIHCVVDAESLNKSLFWYKIILDLLFISVNKSFFVWNHLLKADADDVCLTLSAPNKYSSAIFLFCFQFISASMSLEIGENVIWVSNILDLIETPSYSVSHPDQRCLHMAL